MDVGSDFYLTLTSPDKGALGSLVFMESVLLKDLGKFGNLYALSISAATGYLVGSTYMAFMQAFGEHYGEHYTESAYEQALSELEELGLDQDYLDQINEYNNIENRPFPYGGWRDNGHQCLAPWVKERQKQKNNGQYHIVVAPLALDLDGDGIETVAAKGFSGSLFDHNGNGIIDNGAELFGDNTKLADGSFAKHGYAALTELDSNGDGIVSAADAAFQTLRVWQDLNQDGISQANELRTLEELGIQSLDVAYKDANKNLGNGNTLAQQGSYTKNRRYGCTGGRFAFVRRQPAQPLQRQSGTHCRTGKSRQSCGHRPSARFARSSE